MAPRSQALLIATGKSLLTASLLCLASACITSPNRPANLPGVGVALAPKSDTTKPAATPTTPPPIAPYEQIIPATAKTRHGLFSTHRVGDKLYFEIPPKALNAELLLVGRYARAAAGTAYGGDEFSERTISWERSDNRVILRTLSYSSVADSGLSITRAITAANYSPIIAIFPVEAYGPDSAPVIDVTRLYTTAIPEFMGVHGNLDPSRSYIESALAFPENVEVEATQTGVIPDARDAQSVIAHWSMVRLPNHPMKPRLADERVGYFSIDQTDFGTSQQRAVTHEYIARWRLEKKDSTAALSEPVQPIVYYIDPATPDEWKPWVRKAILDWQPAFEAAGFKNAIIAADPPTDDPDWSPDDVRHTVIRWLPSTTENAEGPHVSDPRTGEILNGSVRMFHNVLNLQRNWYFTQVAPLDVRAQRWPFPDSLMGRLLEFVVAHEIGHTLGLRHDQLGSSLYPPDSLRSPSWIHRMGSAPSIMDYSRFNYVAQPEDHIPVGDLVPRIGPYDHFAIRWGYTPIPNVRNALAERPTLDHWARIQDTIPWLRFAEENPGGDYGTATEAVGDADPVWATTWGIKNLARVMHLIPGAAIRPAEDNSDVAEITTAVRRQWRTELSHVITVVGGSTILLKSGSQPGPVYTPLSRERQQAAVRFLNANAFQTPTLLLDSTLERRYEPSGMGGRINAVQTSLLRSLLADDRMQRLIDYTAATSSTTSSAATSARDVYTITDLLNDVRRGLWSELTPPKNGHVRIDAYRRALQSSYLTLFDEKLNLVHTTPSDAVAVMRDELVTLRADIGRAIPRTADSMTRAHLRASAEHITAILDPKR